MLILFLEGYVSNEYLHTLKAMSTCIATVHILYAHYTSIWEYSHAFLGDFVYVCNCSFFLSCFNLDDFQLFNVLMKNADESYMFLDFTENHKWTT